MSIIEVNDETFKDFLPKRDENTSKFDYGHAAIIGGSYKYGGAPLLSYFALEALRLGAGFSTLYVPEPLYTTYLGREPQIILSAFPSKNGDIRFDEDALKEICLKTTSIAIGMGVTSFIETSKIIEYLLKNYKGNLILDAGALRSLSLLEENLLINPLPSVLLTPHLGEFSRLISVRREELAIDPLKYLNDFCASKKISVILKGHVSFISDGNETYVSKFGNTGLAKGGSGDLLSGILAGLLAQKIDCSLTKKAAFCSYLLGKCADLLLQEESEYSIIANDIIRILPKAIKPCVQN